MVNSRGYTQETALSQRVEDWKDAIQPELLRLVNQQPRLQSCCRVCLCLTPVSVPVPVQEERPAFDIHDYSDRVVAALSSVGHHRSFASIVAGLDNFEACKYLLASLQLVSGRV